MSAAPCRCSDRRVHIMRWVLGVTALLLGLATLVEGGQVLFGGPVARAEAGNVVPMVLIFNFSAGFFYVAAGIATLLLRPWAIWLARSLAVATLIVFAALGVHVLSGGAYEPRTVVAMVVRSGFWIAQALLLPHVFARSLS